MTVVHRSRSAVRWSPAALNTRALGQAWLLLGLVAAVGCLDQSAKAWAWRHLASVHVNSGGNLLVGPVVSGWFRDRATGAAFDALDATLLAAAAMLLVRRRRPPALLGGGALALAGWASNLGDRLGLHFWTAPGSMRGVVDFLPWDGRYWNLADAAIVLGTAVFLAALLALCALATRSLPSPHRTGPPARRSVQPCLVRTLALTLVLLAAAVLAGVGTTSYSGRTTPHHRFAASAR